MDGYGRNRTTELVLKHNQIWVPPVDVERLSPWDFREKVPQWQFLLAVAEASPKVLESLRDGAVPIYRQLCDDLTNANDLALDTARGIVYQPNPALLANLDLLSQHPSACKLKETIEEWGAAHNLSEQWILDIALQTIASWDDRFNRNPLRWGRRCDADQLANPREAVSRFEFQIEENWWPHKVSARAFKARMIAQLNESIDAFLDHSVGDLERRGWRPMPDVRLENQFTWLALFQVETLSPRQIADRVPYRVLENTIMKAIPQTASLIGLTLRPSKKGRKPKLQR
jgi:hypothetical protein